MDRSEPDSLYFERRASEETAAAERAGDERVRQLHIELAERYANAARGCGPAPNDDETDTIRRSDRRMGAEFRILL